MPFYTISGSDFVEMFVGVGASRVRDLFEQAKQNSPAIIFIDEIDAVGRHRGAGIGGGNDEREQTLNQLLVEMDGFDAKTNVILIAATNRPDVLDPALLRPGRFDRQIGVDAPDLLGRKQILEVHAKGKPMAASVDLEVLARKTPGFTGADLANVLNEAALLTARSNAQLIDNRALDEAVDRVMAGPQRRSRLMKDKEKLITAYHEGGHALAAGGDELLGPGDEDHDPPARARTRLHDGDAARGQVLDHPQRAARQLTYAMGGRVAEEHVFHDPTTGAGNDIEKATRIARKMVTEYGMSARVGAVKLGTQTAEPFHGRDMGPPGRLLGRDRRDDRRGGARAHRAGARRGVPGARGQPRHPRPPRVGAAFRRRRSTTTRSPRSSPPCGRSRSVRSGSRARSVPCRNRPPVAMPGRDLVAANVVDETPAQPAKKKTSRTQTSPKPATA